MRRRAFQSHKAVASPPRPRIGLFYKPPHAAADCCVAILKALTPDYDVDLLDIADCTYARMRSLQIVAFPGGVGEADDWSQIFQDAAKDVRLFVQKGGAYLGICMGAYWAGPGYFDLLRNVKVDQYVRKAEIKRSYQTVARVTWNGQPETMFFWDGPQFTGSDFETVATYANGAPMAIQQGRVGLIGCHPEAEESWFARKYLRRHWHGGRHWELLRAFVHTLCVQSPALHR